MKIVIMRGLPGSGKSTWIEGFFCEHESTEVEIFSADHWHMFDGVYKYDPKRAAYAHNECFKAYLYAATVEKHKSHLIVDNTNTTLVELAPYVRVAESLGIDYVIQYITCDHLVAIKRNIHGVPANTILAMHKNLLTEIVPAHWKQEVN